MSKIPPPTFNSTIVSTSLILPQDLEITYLHHPGYLGRKEVGTGIALEPDVPPTIEVMGVWVINAINSNKNINIISLLSESTIKEIAEHILERDYA